MIQGRCATLASVGAWERVRSHARRYRGSRYVFPGLVSSGPSYPAGTAPAKLVTAAATRPRSAPRRPRPAGRRAVTAFRHAPCWAAPGVPLRCVVGGAPHLSRAVLRPRYARARPAPVAPWLAMSNAIDAATRLPSLCQRPPPGYVTELAEPSSAPSPPALPPRPDTRRRGRDDRPC